MCDVGLKNRICNFSLIGILHDRQRAVNHVFTLLFTASDKEYKFSICSKLDLDQHGRKISYAVSNSTIKATQLLSKGF